jgi:hypothetical protein
MEMSKITSQEEIKNSTISGKSDVDTFWDAQEPLLEHCPERGTIINDVHVLEPAEMSCSNQTPRAIIKKVGMLHNNAHLRTATHTIESLHQLNSEVLKHPPCIPDLASPHCCLFGPLRVSLRGHHVASDHEMKEIVYVWLVSQSKTFFSLGHACGLLD